MLRKDKLKMKLYRIKVIQKKERYMTFAFASDVNVEDCEHQAFVEEVVKKEQLYDYSDQDGGAWIDSVEIDDTGKYGLPEIVICANGTLIWNKLRGKYIS